MSDDDLMNRLRNANPVDAQSVAGSASSLLAMESLEAILDGERSRRPWWMRRRAHAPVSVGDATIGRLRTSDPAPERVAAFVDESPMALREATLEEILSGTIAPLGWWRRWDGFSWRHSPIRSAGTASRSRRLRWAVPLVAGSLIAASAAGYVLARSHPTQSLATVCFGADSIAANTDSIALGSLSPIAGCENAWFDGAFGAPRRPHLVSCVLPNGGIGVFPGKNDQVCARLDLSVALSPTEQAEALTAFVEAIRTATNPPACRDRASAEDLVHVELAKYGIAGRKVLAPEPFTPARPCASVIVNYAPPETISIVPRPSYNPPHLTGPTTRR